MGTRKLYYEDCHMDTFTARVLSCEHREGNYLVVLDATAFYPEGGGQPCDTGTLGGVRVTDVRGEGETVFHLCSGPLEVGTQVEGRIDYGARFDRMQQHTGEHIVSGIIHSRYGYHNVGFHMGAELVTIDFDGPIPIEALPEIEAAANRAVWQNLPVRVWYPTPEELPKVGYRTKRELPWPVRIVEIPGFDRCACCGTHVAATGEIGIVKLFSCVKFHNGVRMEMACGRQALNHLNAAYEQNRQVSQAFSARLLETGQAARQINEQLAAEKFRSCGLLRRIFRTIAENYAGQGDVLHFEPDLTSAQVRELADGICQTCGGTAAVFSGSDERGYSYCLMSREKDLRALGKAMTAALRGRGGGKPNLQQGSVQASRREILEFFDKNPWKTVDEGEALCTPKA